MKSASILALLVVATGCASTPAARAPASHPSSAPPAAAVAADSAERCVVTVDREAQMSIMTDTRHSFAIALPGNGYATSCVAHGNELMSARRTDLGFIATVTLDRVAPTERFDEARYLAEAYAATVSRFEGTGFVVGPRRDPPAEAGTTLVYSISGDENGVSKTSLNAWHLIPLPQGYVLRHHVSWTMPTADVSPEHEAVVAVTASLIHLVAVSP